MVRTGTQHDGMGTVWIRREAITYLKSVAVVRGDATLDETVAKILEHYQSCTGGLDVDLRNAQRRLEALKQIKLVVAR